MYESKELGEKRVVSCQSCGGDKPWNVVEWIYHKGSHFCSYYCQDNFASFLLRMARKGKKGI